MRSVEYAVVVVFEGLVPVVVAATARAVVMLLEVVGELLAAADGIVEDAGARFFWTVTQETG